MLRRVDIAFPDLISRWIFSSEADCHQSIVSLEKNLGYELDAEWLNSLALITQVVPKVSSLNWNHGRLLYCLLRDMVEKRPGEYLEILETGTARGFSSICMARAIADGGGLGKITTVDVLDDGKKRYWSSISDYAGKFSRRQLLQPWENLRARIDFVTGRSPGALDTIPNRRWHFVFLDSEHTEENLRKEIEFASLHQIRGDVIVCDDYTKNQFPGVVSAVEQLRKRGLYSVKIYGDPLVRGYAVAVRL